MFKKISTRAWMFIIGGICAALTVLAIVAVVKWSLSVVFVFPPAVFAFALIASAASLGEGSSSAKPQRKPEKVKKEDIYISPFFLDKDDPRNNNNKNNKNSGGKKK